MKKIFGTLCMAAALTVMSSCGNKNGFTINGTVEGDQLEGETIYLLNKADMSTPADSAVVTDGRFTFKGMVDEPWAAILGNGAFRQRCIVEPGTIEVTVDSIGGTPLNDKYFASQKTLNLEDIENQLNGYAQLYYSAPDAETRAEAERLYDSVEAIAKKRIMEVSWALYNENRDNILGAVAMEDIAQTGDYNYRELDSILSGSETARNYAPVAKRLEQLKAIDATSAGKHYTDIEGVDGKLSEIIDGKLALVDFYASWCGPCRNEIRDNLVPLWKKYEKRGLVIVGLNVWERGSREEREAAHAKVMADLGITYPQLVDSTRRATDTYGVEGIPQIMLIGADGTIIARDLRGDAIEEAIEAALK